MKCAQAIGGKFSNVAWKHKMLHDETLHDVIGGHQTSYIKRFMKHRILKLAKPTHSYQTARALRARRDYKVDTLGIKIDFIDLTVKWLSPPGEQHTNLWVSCSYLGVKIWIYVCHYDF